MQSDTCTERTCARSGKDFEDPLEASKHSSSVSGGSDADADKQHELAGEGLQVNEAVGHGKEQDSVEESKQQSS